MVYMGMASVRFEVSELSVAKSGWTTLFVDKNHVEASDDNDGYSWARPKQTLAGAMTDAKPWCKVFVRSGEYDPVTIPYEHVQLFGMIEDGPDVARIMATDSTGLVITAGFCEVANIAIETENQHGIQATTPGHYFHDIAIEMNNPGGTNKNGIWLHDADRTEVERAFIDGQGADEVIGILIGDDTIEANVHDCYIANCGDGIGAGCAAGGVCTNNGYAVGIHENAQRSRVYENDFVNNCVGVYFYKEGDDIFKGHSIIHNECYENCNHDFYDQYSPGISGISIRENFYGYTDWFLDSNNDGRADYIISCGSNLDYEPLAAPQSWRTHPLPRAGVI